MGVVWELLPRCNPVVARVLGLQIQHHALGRSTARHSSHNWFCQAKPAVQAVPSILGVQKPKWPLAIINWLQEADQELLTLNDCSGTAEAKSTSTVRLTVNCSMVVRASL
jgi:hypothetical protein